VNAIVLSDDATPIQAVREAFGDDLPGGSMKALVLALAVGLAAIETRALTFTAGADFASGNSLTLRGSGTWTVEQWPAGSGVAAPTIMDTADGFLSFTNTVFRYLAAPDDVGSSVVASWTIDRPIATTGEFGQNYSEFDLLVELLQDEGKPINFHFEMETVRVFVGGGTGAIASLDGSKTLTPASASLDFHISSLGSSFVGTNGNDFLRQAVTFSFGPEAAGQEILFYLPNGVTSTNIEPAAISVASPSTALLAIPPTVIFLLARSRIPSRDDIRTLRCQWKCVRL
jgi:hypothetical protein